MRARPFRSIQDIKDEKVRLQRHRVGYEHRLKELSSELSDPKRFGKLFKNSALSSLGLKGGNAGKSTGIASITTAALGVILGSKMVGSKKGKVLKLLVAVGPYLLPDKAFWGRLSNELKVSMKRTKDFMERRSERKHNMAVETEGTTAKSA